MREMLDRPGIHQDERRMDDRSGIHQRAVERIGKGLDPRDRRGRRRSNASADRAAG